MALIKDLPTITITRDEWIQISDPESPDYQRFALANPTGLPGVPELTAADCTPVYWYDSAVYGVVLCTEMSSLDAGDNIVHVRRAPEPLDGIAAPVVSGGPALTPVGVGIVAKLRIEKPLKPMTWDLPTLMESDIRDLQQEAREASDGVMVDVCESALGGHEPAILECISALLDSHGPDQLEEHLLAVREEARVFVLDSIQGAWIPDSGVVRVAIEASTNPVLVAKAIAARFPHWGTWTRG